jgi:hypothetical protein
VPPYAIVFGSPAKIYKYRFTEEEIRRIEESNYWDYEPSIAKKIISEITK